MDRVKSTLVPNVFDTVKYTSPMILKTEYSDYFKAFKVH